MRRIINSLFFLFIFLFSSNLFASELNFHITLTDDVKYKKNFSNFSYTNNKAKIGGEISFGVVGNFDSLNPFILKGVSAESLSLLYDSLFVKSLDEIDSAYPLIAEYYYFDKKEQSLIFKIKNNALWHDGKNITSNDILFTYNILKKYGHPYYKLILSRINNVKILNDNNIAYYVDDINDKKLLMTIALLPILPKHYYANNQFSDDLLNIPLGSGPYKVDDFQAGRKISYKKFNDYWGKNLNVNKYRYNFNYIKYNYYRDSNIAIQALKAGEYDLRIENIAKNWANAYDADFLSKKNFKKLEIKHKNSTGMQCFVLNNRLDKFKDINFRRALNLAFNYDWINKNIFYNSYKRNNSFFANSIYEAKGDISLFEINYLEERNYNIKNYLTLNNYNADAKISSRENLLIARYLLESSGYKIKNFKLHDKNNNQIKLNFLLTSKSFHRVILPYINDLKQLGIDSEVRVVDFSNYQKLLENFDFDIIVGYFGVASIPGDELKNSWHSSTANLAGSRNLAGINDNLIDKLIEDILSENKFNNKLILTRLLDRVLINNSYIIPHWHIAYHRLIFKDKFTLPYYLPDYALDFHSWSIK
ncbi:MAG: ABC transporter substrate-binding protein [Rickettsiales bacterium]|nr:ABC transporter substrate-binding protein [Rickettsiales bacterium]